MTILALDGYTIGYALGSLMIPLIGLILLIIGIIQRSRSGKQQPSAMPWPGYPGQGPHPAGSPYPPPPPGYGPQSPPPGHGPYPPPGAAPYPPPPGPWPSPQRKRRGTFLMITGAVILGLSLLALMARAGDAVDRSSSSSAAEGMTIGQCISDSDFAKGDATPTDCEDPSAVLELVSKGEANADCPDGKGRTDTDYTTLFWDDATLCFAANFIEGNCYGVDTSIDAESPFTHEDCGASPSQVKVVQRFDGTADETRCPAGTNPVSYRDPARLFCLVAAQ